MKKSDAEYIWGLMPTWVKCVEKGLDPTMYGTCTKEGDEKVHNELRNILFGEPKINGFGLRSCPFCSSDDIEVERIGTNRASCIIVCSECGCRKESNEIGYGDHWNMRAD